MPPSVSCDKGKADFSQLLKRSDRKLITLTQGTDDIPMLHPEGRQLVAADVIDVPDNEAARKADGACEEYPFAVSAILDLGGCYAG